MAWVYLVFAGIFEWGWPVGLKLGLADTGMRWGRIAFAGVCMAASGVTATVDLVVRACALRNTRCERFAEAGPPLSGHMENNRL